MIEIKHKTTQAVLIRIHAATLRNVDLSGAQLAGASLVGLDLSYARLTRANLQDADLSRACLLGACLDHCELSHALLRNSQMVEASLKHARLFGSDLEGSTLRYSHLASARLVRAKLAGADLSMSDAHGADLTDAMLPGANLRGINLLDATLLRADLTNADLTGATLTHALVKDARLQGAKLAHVVTKETAPENDPLLAAGVLQRMPEPAAEGQSPTKAQIRCPECNAAFAVPRDRFDHHLTCPACQERFYVDRNGDVHLKKPVPRMDWEPELRGSAPSVAAWEVSDKFVKIFTGSALAVVGFVVFSFLGSGIWWFASRLPSDVQQRSAIAAQALIDNDDDQLRALADVDMENSTSAWFQLLRATQWEAIRTAENDVHITANVQSEDREARLAWVQVNVRATGAAPGEASLLTFEIPWTLNRSGEWRINANLLRAISPLQVPNPSPSAAPQ